MERQPGEHTRVRIFIGENDRYGQEPLYRAIVHMLRREGMAGATVIRGVMGFGAKSVMHTANILRLSENLPMIVEFVESRENVNKVLPVLDGMIGEGLVTLERVCVVRYNPRSKAPE